MFYRFVKSLVRGCFRLYFRWEVYGSHNLPTTGGVIIAANHVSYLDPPLMGCAVDRPVHFMAKRELFQIPVLGWLIRQLNAFPVQQRGADRRAIRHALEVLRSGKVVGIFPEGTRGNGRVLLKPQPGCVLLAAKARVPIVPMAITGAEKVVPTGKLFPRPAKIRVFVGEPIYLSFDGSGPSRENLAQYSQLVMEKIDEMLTAMTAVG